MSPDPTSLDRLHDVVAPPSVPWWPPAPGWYWVLGVLLVLVLVLVLRSFIWWQRNRYRREALAESEKLRPLLANPESRVTALVALAELLKRTALSAFPRTRVASLTGSAWVAFLDSTIVVKGFYDGVGRMLESAAYEMQPSTTIGDFEAEEVMAFVQHWIAHHHTGKELPC